MCGGVGAVVHVFTWVGMVGNMHLNHCVHFVTAAIAEGGGVWLHELSAGTVCRMQHACVCAPVCTMHHTAVLVLQ